MMVSTSLATRGLALRAGQDLEVRDDPDEFADAIVGLLQDRDRAGRMGRTGQAHLRSLVDPRVNLDRVAALMASPR